MIKTKLVTLTPTDSFFFGGEQTFGNGEGRNFYAESRYFPQQTSIVGLIRHVIFEGDQDKTFGESFVVDKASTTKENNFGWLKSLSPVFIHHTTKKMGLPMRFIGGEEAEDCSGEESIQDVTIQPKEATQVDFGNGFQEAIILEHYKEKYATKDRIVFKDSTETYESIFRKVIKTGIKRDRKTRMAEDGMFYRQLFYQMKKDYAFGLYITADERLFPILKKRNMPFGGEKVNFVFKVHEDGIFDSSPLAKSVAEHAIVLVSDAYVSEEVYQHCTLAMADTISFRNIITPSDYTSDINQNGESTSKRYKSEKFTLIKRGSIFFPKGEIGRTEIVRLLNNKQFKDIGYNHFFEKSKTI